MKEFHTAEIIPFDRTKQPVRKVRCSFCLQSKDPIEGIIDSGHGHAICFTCVVRCNTLIKESDRPEPLLWD